MRSQILQSMPRGTFEKVRLSDLILLNVERWSNFDLLISGVRVPALCSFQHLNFTQVTDISLTNKDGLHFLTQTAVAPI